MLQPLKLMAQRAVIIIALSAQPCISGVLTAEEHLQGPPKEVIFYLWHSYLGILKSLNPSNVQSSCSGSRSQTCHEDKTDITTEVSGSEWNMISSSKYENEKKKQEGK